MANTFLKFISDEHLISSIKKLYESYVKAKKDIDKKKFYSNKIDPIKLTFDLEFSDNTEEELLESEISRQIDKSINNAIGTFHEDILGGITGYEKGNLSGYDIKAQNNTLFADIKNKHNTMNSSAAESLFQKLEKFANKYPKSTCYWVAIWATDSYDLNWAGKINGSLYSHPRVKKISGDQFYKLLSKRDNALLELYSILPTAINHFLKTAAIEKAPNSSAITEINKSVAISGRDILKQIAFDNFKYYLGFDKLK